jgi:hypothetical protein
MTAHPIPPGVSVDVPYFRSAEGANWCADRVAVCRTRVKAKKNFALSGQFAFEIKHM